MRPRSGRLVGLQWLDRSGTSHWSEANHTVSNGNVITLYRGYGYKTAVVKDMSRAIHPNIVAMRNGPGPCLALI